MGRPLIVLGDKTSHGGTVIGADLTIDIDGRYLARIGDPTVCPRCKGVFAITSAAPDMVDATGRGYARHLDRTACGAQLLAGQSFAWWGDESSLEASAASEPSEALAAAAGIAAPTSSGLCLDCLRKAAHFGSATVARE